MKTVAVSLVACALFGSAYANDAMSAAKISIPDPNGLAEKYPASFPYESEKYVGVTPPGQDNVLDPINTPDVGGYTGKSLAYCNPFAFWPYGLFHTGTSDSPCGAAYFLFFASFYKFSKEDIVPYNCTMNDIKIHPPFNGNFVGSEQVCDGDACCQKYQGVYMLAKDWLPLQEKWDIRFNKYGCTWLTEDMYCGILMALTNWCQEFYVTEDNTTATKRVLLNPCTNAFTHFFAGCKAFKVLGAKVLVEALKIEPAEFIPSMNAEEANTALAVFYNYDHVCYPLSSIVPDMKAEGAAPAPADSTPADSTPDSSTPAATPAATPASTPASDDSSASAPAFALAAIVAIIAGLF